MTTNNRIPLGTDGGGVDPQQLVDQAEGEFHLFIGIGGTGVEALRSIKTRVYQSIKPDNLGVAEFEYSRIRFLGIDSDNGSAGTEQYGYQEDQSELLPLSESEFFNIGDSALLLMLRSASLLPEFEWLSPGLHSPILSSSGGGGIRQVGRIFMVNQSAAFIDHLENEYERAVYRLGDNQEVFVHVLAGLSGGTGGGAFLDVCYMVKHALPRARVLGYFFLPDLNLQKVRDPLMQKYIKSNAYAAMQELDYCMQIPENGGAFDQAYGGNEIVKWRSAPVDIPYLISAVNSEGRVHVDQWRYTIDSVAECALTLLVRRNNDVDLRAPSHLTMDSSGVKSIVEDCMGAYFETSSAPGIHSYEDDEGKLDMPFSDWRKLPSLEPQRLIDLGVYTAL